MTRMLLWAQTPTPTPSPTRLLIEAPADPLGQIVAVVAIALALAAAFLGYRIIRGGRGL
jgi:hypothetical protein